MRNRGGWSTDALEYLRQVQAVLDELRAYWPLTLRQVYYQLVAGLVIENNRSTYQKLSRILAKARIDNRVPWEALEDRARTMLESAGYVEKSDFVETELFNFLRGYRRDLLQSQPVALEVWIEKDALSRVCYNAAFPYCVPVIVARGFSSVSYVNECRKRVEANARAGKQTVILYFGDLDPSGWEMLPSMLETLRGEMGLEKLVEGQRCALTPEQVEAYNLPRSVDAMKDTDTRTPKFKAMLRSQGYDDTLAVELDALPPAVLEDLTREAIERKLDLSQLQAERGMEQLEFNALREFKASVERFVAGE